MHPAPADIYRIVGQAVRARRCSAKLTQEELGERAGLTRNYVGDVERAERNITLESLAKLARVLKCRVRDLVHDA